MKLRPGVIVGLLSLTLAGCGIVHTTPAYVSSTDNFFVLRDLKGRQLNVGAFTSSGSEKVKACRAASVGTPDGGDFAGYVRNAFVHELSSAGVYSPNAPVMLTGNLDAIELAAFQGEWTMTLTLRSSNGRSLVVASKTNFNMAWDGKTACTQAANEFVRATQLLVAKSIGAPEFPELIR